MESSDSTKKPSGIFKCNTDSVFKSEKTSSKKKKMMENDIFEEIPATQSPPKVNKKSKSSNTKNESFSKDNIQIPEYKPIKNKALKRVQDVERNFSMISSPSIMNKKQHDMSEPQPSTSTARSPPKPHKYSIDEIFNELKKTEDEMEESTTVTKEQDPVETSEVVAESTDNDITMKDALPPVKPFIPNPWSNINIDALKHLKDNSSNIRKVIDDLKKAK